MEGGFSRLFALPTPVGLTGKAELTGLHLGNGLVILLLRDLAGGQLLVQSLLPVRLHLLQPGGFLLLGQFGLLVALCLAVGTKPEPKVPFRCIRVLGKSRLFAGRGFSGRFRGIGRCAAYRQSSSHQHSNRFHRFFHILPS